MAALSLENRLRIAAIVGAAAAIAVIVAQFMDYTGFEIGSGGVESANEVAPRPIIEKAGVGDDQLWLGIPLGIAALLALRLAWGGQWRLGRSIAMIGAVALVLTLGALLPNATDGDVGGEIVSPELTHVDASETILGGFWVQLVGSVGLIGSGVAMARWHLDGRPSGARRRGSRRGARA